ncbi:MAG: UPF0262 family protein [Pseudomonadota bacterium]
MSSSDARLIAIDLDDSTIIWRSADIEQERRIAIYDLLEENVFDPVKDYPSGYGGPYKVFLRVTEGRLAFDISDEAGNALESIILALSPFRRLIREYFAVCDSYFKAIKTATPSQIEAIDMGRRGIHNEASELLQERLEGKINIDFQTARRLFTLVCVLHIR